MSAGAARVGAASHAVRRRCDEGRVAGMIDAIAAISDPGDGINRIAYTPAERRAHDLVAGWLRDLGAEIRIDAVGNTIAEFAGREPALPALGSGSHLDSVPEGGRFDGIAGVVAAIEAVRVTLADGEQLRHPLRIIAFAAEEGARFGQACLGSKAAAGMIVPADTHALVDLGGTTLAQAMAALGFDPERMAEAIWNPQDWAAFVELHIEQGRVLESEGIDIGIVDVISGSTRIRMDLTGRPSHTGGTPMDLRADALAAAAEIVLFAERVANDARHRGTRATVGQLTVKPNVVTTIPGHVRLTVDVRDVDSDRQRETALEIDREANDICVRRGIGRIARVVGDISPVVLPVRLRNVTIRAARAVDLPYRVLVSGASHDAQVMNAVTPSAMIFVPSRAGISHDCAEWTSASQIAHGADVLRAALALLDTELDRSA
jgi:allantoate deiminase